jgi:hypothetical protein
VQIELTEEEVTSLRRVVDAAVRDLSYEIANTDNARFRGELRQDRDVLRTVLDRLTASRTP